MVVKIYISGISGNKEVKKRQQRVLMILESKNVEYQVIDITEPGKEDEKEFMQTNSTVRDSKHPLPPQIFNNDDYCGDYEDFDLANEMDELEKFLKPPTLDSSAEPTEEKNNESNNIRQNGNTSSREASTDKDVSVVHSESELNERHSSIAGDDNDNDDNDEDDDNDKLNSEEIDKTKSMVDGDYEAEELEDKNEEKSDEQEKEE